MTGSSSQVTTPQQTWDDESALCAEELMPRVITGALLQTIRKYFCDADNIRSELLQSYVWNSDKRLTKIDIVTPELWDKTRVEKRPAVLVKRAAVRSRNLAIDDSAGESEHGTHYVVQIAGSHVVTAVARTAGCADELAQSIWFDLIRWAPAFRSDLGLRIFRAPELGPVQRVNDESWEHYVSGLTATWVYEGEWVLKVEELPIKRIDINIETRT